MSRQKKTYTDLYLDNTELASKKKREKYFDEPEEAAILRFNDIESTERERGVLFEEIIEPAFRKTISGVMEMPKFRHLPRGFSRDQLFDDTMNRLVEKINKFRPGMIGKSGLPVKAFSYFSTIAKNFILEKKVRHEKILKNKADVESSIDLSILSEDTLRMMSNYDRTDIHFDDYQTTFNNTRTNIVGIIDEVVKAEEMKAKKDEDLIKIGYYLKYLLEHWDKIEFMKKNEFMRILTLYTGLKQQQVSFLFKKFKVAVFKKIKPAGVSKSNKASREEEEVEDVLEILREEAIEDGEILDLLDEDMEAEPELETFDPINDAVESKYFLKYSVNSFEEFESQLQTMENDKLKPEIEYMFKKRVPEITIEEIEALEKAAAQKAQE